ncbi:GntR family transcriptional regulator [Sphingopyxis sp. Q841]|uniref:GntR family transcriptional regulator n=1 Tax=Sphingopyxis sp. Q841 TaxID=3458250 RepID=UPI004036DBAA
MVESEGKTAILRMPVGSDITLDAPRSQTSVAYQAIRADILRGHHVPDKKLKILELATELGVSQAAVREALSRLVPEQLVISRDQRGFVVAPLSLADLTDLTDFRCEIEAAALARSVERGDVNWEADILAAEHRLRNLPKDLPEAQMRETWMSSHASFHRALVSACGNQRMLALHAQLYEQSERYRGLMFHVQTNRNLDDEHHGMLQLALARNADALVELTVAHLRKTAEIISTAFGHQTTED